MANIYSVGCRYLENEMRGGGAGELSSPFPLLACKSIAERALQIEFHSFQRRIFQWLHSAKLHNVVRALSLAARSQEVTRWLSWQTLNRLSVSDVAMQKLHAKSPHCRTRRHRNDLSLITWFYVWVAAALLLFAPSDDEEEWKTDSERRKTYPHEVKECPVFCVCFNLITVRSYFFGCCCYCPD